MALTLSNWKKAKNDSRYYNALSDDGKKKFWEYGVSNGLVPYQNLPSGAKAEMAKYGVGKDFYDPQYLKGATEKQSESAKQYQKEELRFGKRYAGEEKTGEVKLTNQSDVLQGALPEYKDVTKAKFKPLLPYTTKATEQKRFAPMPSVDEEQSAQRILKRLYPDAQKPKFTGIEPDLSKVTGSGKQFGTPGVGAAIAGGMLSGFQGLGTILPRSEKDIALEQQLKQVKPFLPSVSVDVSRGFAKPNIQQKPALNPYIAGEIASVSLPAGPAEQAITRLAGKTIGLGAKGVKAIASKLSKGKKLTAQEIKVVAENPDIIKELGLPEGTTIDDFMKQQQQVSREVESDVYLEGLERQFPNRKQPQAQQITPQVKPPTKVMAEQIQAQPKVVAGVTKVETPSTGSKVANVLIDMPKKTTPPIFENAARVYQEAVSTALPLERIGKVAPKVSQQASLGRKTTGSVDYVISKAMTDTEGNEVGKSLFDVFKDVPEESKSDLFEYALHKHNLARYEQGKPVFGESVDQTVSQAKLAEIEARNPQIAEQAKEMTNYMSNLMENWALKSGLVNQETLQTLKGMYPDYVPTYRAKDADKAIVGGSKGNVANAIKKAKGGSDDILPLDQQMAQLTNRMIRSARKNELYNSIQDAFESNPEFVERFFKPITKEKQLVDEGIEGIVDTFDEPIKKVGDTYELTYFRNGEKVKAQISNDMYEAIRPLADENALADIARKYATGPFKALVTGYNPIFIVKNIMRDIPTAFIYSKDGLGWAKNMPVALKEIMSNGKYWKEYQALGGTRSGIFSYEKGISTPFAGKNELLPVKGARKVLNAVETMNNVTETLPRFAEYLNTVKKGGNTYESRIQGMLNASDITTDFTRHGKTTKFVDAFVPYLNPSVQGIDKTIRQFATRPLQTSLKGGAVISLPTVILDQINKNNRDYKEISEREKSQNYLIPDGEGNFTRIPKSRETGVVFSTLLEWIARSARGEKLNPKDIVNTVKENFSPVNVFENSIITPALKAWEQVKEPTKEVRNYAGIPIVPKQLQKLENKEQYDQYTSEVAKQIGATIDISPKVIDYLIRSYSGILGQTLLPKTSASQRGAFEAAFKTDPVFKSGLTGKMYDALEEKKRAVDTAKTRGTQLESGITNDVKILDKYSGYISDLRKKQKEVDTMKLEKDEKEKRIRELQKQMNNYARTALELTER